MRRPRALSVVLWGFCVPCRTSTVKPCVHLLRYSLFCCGSGELGCDVAAWYWCWPFIVVVVVLHSVLV